MTGQIDVKSYGKSGAADRHLDQLQDEGQGMTDSTHSSSEIHKEHIFEEHIATTLVNEQGYIQRDCEAHYNAELALDTEPLFNSCKQRSQRHGGNSRTITAGLRAECLKRLKKLYVIIQPMWFCVRGLSLSQISISPVLFQASIKP